MEQEYLSRRDTKFYPILELESFQKDKRVLSDFLICDCIHYIIHLFIRFFFQKRKTPLVQMLPYKLSIASCQRTQDAMRSLAIGFIHHSRKLVSFTKEICRARIPLQPFPLSFSMTSFPPYISLLVQEELSKVKLVKPFQILYGTDAA